MNKKLVDAEKGNRRIIITMPPRHGKSMLTSHFFPAWYIARNPDKRVLMAGYQAQFASRWGRKARAVIDGVGKETFDVSISKKSSAADRWDIEGYMGGMETAGVGGALTGKGADLLIIDDPISNSADANSETMRENLWDWYRTTAYTRLEPNASAIVIQTRWHEDDLAGRLIEEMKNGGEQWDVFNLPAVAEENDLLGRQFGEALWPARYDEKKLAVIQKVEGPHNWYAMYQQRPAPADGVIFKRSTFRYYTRQDDVYQSSEGQRWRVRDCWKFATVDLAISKKTGADWTVIQAWAAAPDGASFLLDQHRERMNAHETVDAIRSMMAKHQCGFAGVESVSFQLAVIEIARREGLSIKEIAADGDKEARARAASYRLAGHNVYFPAGASWLETFESELLSFPNGKHDDQVDGFSYAMHEVSQRSAGSKNKGGIVDVGNKANEFRRQMKGWLGS